MGGRCLQDREALAPHLKRETSIKCSGPLHALSLPHPNALTTHDWTSHRVFLVMGLREVSHASFGAHPTNSQAYFLAVSVLLGIGFAWGRAVPRITQ